MCSRLARTLALALVTASIGTTAAALDQRTVRASSGWIRSTGAEATAGAVIENGTMYDIYITSGSSEAAGSVQLVQISGEQVTPVKEVLIGAFDRLEMSPAGTYLRLTQLTQPLKSGDTVTLALQTDGGEQLTVQATVK